MNDILQIGVGGAFALLVIREILKFVSEYKKNGNSINKVTASGERSVEFWQKEIRTGVKDAFTESVLPAIIRQTEIMREMNESMSKAKDSITELVILNRERMK